MSKNSVLYMFGVPRRDFKKIPCKTCRLRTEHVKVALVDGTFVYSCLRCRATRTEQEVASDSMKGEMLELPEDERMPVGVA